MEKTIKTLLTIAVCCLSISGAHAQRYYEDRGSRRSYYDLTGTVASYLDLHFGEGIGRGAKGIGGADVAFLYRMSPILQFGVGAGIDYIHALALQGKVDKKNEYDYHGELTMPVFIRGRYLLADAGYARGANFFVQCDLGYRFGLSAYNTSKKEGIIKNLEKCNVKGLFFEPQFGVALNETLSLSLGLPIQHYNKLIRELPVGATVADVPTKTRSLMFMGTNIRLMIGF